MARQVNKLSARFVATVVKPGEYSDGGGLYLIVEPSGAKRWQFHFRWRGKRPEMGMGGLGSVPLAEARSKAEAARRMVVAGVNPKEARDAAKSADEAAKTFGQCVDAWLGDNEASFRNEKHRQQWRNTLDTYAVRLKAKPVGQIVTADVLEVLKPIWSTKAETASRVRGRIERILDAAKTSGLRDGENPARWRGHLQNLLPARSKVQAPVSHAAMPYDSVPAFVANLRKRPAVAALALEFTILCASRTGEVTGAMWPEIDRTAKVWTIPAARMKAGKEHRVPLTPRALEILAAVEKLRTGDFVFPGPRSGRSLSNMAMAMLLRRMKADEITVHGFRSAFRDWCGECTAFPREVAEHALAHVIGNKAEQAYRRGDALEKRRTLMTAWANFIEGETGSNVVQLTRTA